jgi:hypothetical protein
MYERAGFMQTVNRGYLVLATIAAVFALWALAPAAAHASGCTDSWTNSAGGNWFTGSNWSKEAPPAAGEEACITLNGTYTVTMTQTSSTVSLGSLTVGGSSGTQTLAVGSSCSLNAILTTTAGISNGAQGAIVLTNGEGCGDNVTVNGPITNAGTLTSEPASGGSRSLLGNLTNTGTLAINTNTADNGASTTWTNEGTIDLATGKELAVSSKNSLTNGTGGTIAAAGSGDVVLSGATFTEGAGTTSGTQPVVVDDGTLNYAGTGASVIALRGNTALSGTLGSAQTLSIQSTCSENVVATAAEGTVNGGTIKLTNGDGCGDNATLAIPAGTLTNSGKIVSEPVHGGTRTLQGSIANPGTLAINANTAYNGASATLTNHGALNVAEGIQLTVSNKGSVVNSGGGKITAGTGGDVFNGSETSFTEGAGTTSGAKPVIVDDGKLTYAAGGGASVIALRGVDTLVGSLVAGQSLSVESTCSENVTVTASESFTNAGTITLTNADGCSDNATLIVSAGTLTNSGKIVTEPAIGGTRTLQGNITNTGTLSIKANTAYSGAGALLTNEGAVDLAEAIQLTVSNSGAFTNGTGGSIAPVGSGNVFLDSGTTFTEGAGTTSGVTPVFVDDGTLDYTGSGASTIALRGSDTLEGNVASGQVLTVESTCSENATATATASFSNAGQITLTNGDGCGNNATLAISAGTLTNTGKIITEPAIAGTRTLQGNITNKGTLAIKTNTTYSGSGAQLINEGPISLSNGIVLTVTGSPTVTNGAGGEIGSAGNGSLQQTGGTFNEGLGKTFGSEPVILDDMTLNETEHGAGPIALRGASNLTGNVKAGEELLIESSCSENATVTAAGSFANFGTIELTNGDGCGNNTTLNLKGGTLTNGANLDIDNPHGGSRAIDGNVINNSTLSLAAGETLQLTGNYTQGSVGRYKTFLAGSSTFGAMSVSGTATLAGVLVVRQSSFKGTAGQTFGILSSAALSGTFAEAEIEDAINYAGLYYKPTYSATGVTLVVTQATLVLSAKSGAPGSTVTLTGTGYLPGDTVTPTFVDHKGVSTALPSTTINSSGELSEEITIPPTAAVGAGTIKVAAAQTGVHITDAFNVT